MRKAQDRLFFSDSYLYYCVKFSLRRILRIRITFSFYYYFIWKADDETAGTSNCRLSDTQMIRTIGFCHFHPSIFYFTYVGITYGDYLVLTQGIGSIKFSIHCDFDCSVISPGDYVNENTQECGKQKKDSNKNKFFLFQIGTS